MQVQVFWFYLLHKTPEMCTAKRFVYFALAGSFTHVFVHGHGYLEVRPNIVSMKLMHALYLNDECYVFIFLDSSFQERLRLQPRVPVHSTDCWTRLSKTRILPPLSQHQPWSVWKIW